MSRKKIADEVKLLRQSRSWSQAQLAEITTLSLRTIQRLESNGRCAHETLLSIAAAFDIEVEHFTQLFARTDSLFLGSFLKWSIIRKFMGMFAFLKKFSFKQIALFSAILIFPAFYFVLANILNSYLGIDFLHHPLTYIYSDPKGSAIFNLLSPIVFLGGVCAAAFLNIYTLFNMTIRKNQDTLIGTLTLKTRLLNLVIAGLSILLLMIMLGYGLVENIAKLLKTLNL